METIPWRDGLYRDLQNPEFARVFLNEVAAWIEQLQDLTNTLVKNCNKIREERNEARKLAEQRLQLINSLELQIKESYASKI